MAPKTIKPIAKPIDPTDPAMPPRSVINAIRSLRNGDATPEQQQRALEWIVTGAALTNVWGWNADPSKKDLLLGRQFVGQQIVAILNMPLAILEDL